MYRVLGTLIVLVTLVFVYESNKVSTPRVETDNDANMIDVETETISVVEPEVKTRDSSTSELASLPTFTTATLATYDGSDPSLPIHIAFEGKVYDVTPGKSYYEQGGSYDFLSGTDGTPLLKIIGGDLIKQKYKVIGSFTP
jgi:predicted heme/steroid binding protein